MSDRGVVVISDSEESDEPPRKKRAVTRGVLFGNKVRIRTVRVMVLSLRQEVILEERSCQSNTWASIPRPSAFNREEICGGISSR